MVFDPSNDYVIWDGVEAVTLSRTVGSEETTCTVPHAIREPLTKAEVASFGTLGIEGETCAFNLPRPLMMVASDDEGGEGGDDEGDESEEYKPLQGDTLTDQYDVQWIVMGISYAELIQQYRLTCVRSKG